MTIEIKVPPLPESVSDATLVAWHKTVGEGVARDENLVDLETDKVVLEVPAPAAGTISKIIVEDGTTVVAGDVLAILEEGEVAAAEPAAPEKKTEKKAAPAPREQKGPVKTSPAVRRLLDEHDLDATMVTGSGKDGRITKADVMSFLKTDDSSNVTPGDPAPLSGDTVAAGLERSEQRVPMTRLRARIAERLVDAQQTAAMLTTFNEVDLTEVMAMRSRYKETFEKKHGVRLGFMSFFAKAAVEALKTPALIVQGTRDRFGTEHEVATYPLSTAIELAWIEDGDHSLKPRKKSGRTLGQNLDDAARAAIALIRRCAPNP